MIFKPFSLAFAAAQAFAEHVGRLPDTDDNGEAIEVWANRAAELSRTAADAAAEYADESYRLGLITADLLFGRLIEAEAFHSRNQRIVREGLAAVARAREDTGQPAGSGPYEPEAAHGAPGARHRLVLFGATAVRQC
ncbi:hypothetical protein [Streptomyces sp. NRRL S-350]|uniref:hypothetical protein n=1 Tax=Streptomyces sp. NRRL S-350 TaxID=1463902 RepID=UPI0004C1E59E|nr:hypothetical protein [Streptomyces sp. NRRL S-350]